MTEQSGDCWSILLLVEDLGYGLQKNWKRQRCRFAFLPGQIYKRYLDNASKFPEIIRTAIVVVRYYFNLLRNVNNNCVQNLFY